MDLISVITPVYNSSKYIAQTVQSVIDQSYLNWELIIVDDCSNDHTEEIIREIMGQDKRLIYKRLNKNMGAGVARNEALKLSSGKFIAFLDSDDIWLPEKLEKQIKFMLEGNYPISFTAYELIDHLSNKLNKRIGTLECIDLKRYLKDTRIGFSTSMINKDIVGEFRMIDIRSRQDGQLWISLMKRGHKAYGLNKVLCLYRIHNKSISANKIKTTIQIWRLYYKIEKLGFLKSLYYFTFYLYNAIKKRI